MHPDCEEAIAPLRGNDQEAHAQIGLRLARCETLADHLASPDPEDVGQVHAVRLRVHARVAVVVHQHERVRGTSVRGERPLWAPELVVHDQVRRQNGGRRRRGAIGVQRERNARRLPRRRQVLVGAQPLHIVGVDRTPQGRSAALTEAQDVVLAGLLRPASAAIGDADESVGRDVVQPSRQRVRSAPHADRLARLRGNPDHQAHGEQLREVRGGRGLRPHLQHTVAADVKVNDVGRDPRQTSGRVQLAIPQAVPCPIAVHVPNVVGSRDKHVAIDLHGERQLPVAGVGASDGSQLHEADPIVLVVAAGGERRGVHGEPVAARRAGRLDVRELRRTRPAVRVLADLLVEVGVGGPILLGPGANVHVAVRDEFHGEEQVVPQVLVALFVDVNEGARVFPQERVHGHAELHRLDGLGGRADDTLEPSGRPREDAGGLRHLGEPLHPEDFGIVRVIVHQFPLVSRASVMTRRSSITSMKPLPAARPARRAASGSSP